MDFKDLVKANGTIKTTDIKGKAYAEVNERIKVFRMLFPNGTISTEIISLADGVVVFKASALDEEGRILATGHAYEKENSTFINKTSYIENAETSAVGRALGMLGIGIDVSVASYEEVANAIENQKPEKVKKEDKRREEKKEDSRTALRNFLKETGLDPNKVVQACGLTNESTEEDFAMALVYAKNLIGG